jgi:hypothetical protein
MLSNTGVLCARYSREIETRLSSVGTQLSVIETRLSSVETFNGLQAVLHTAFFITHHAYQQLGLRSMLKHFWRHHGS